MSNPPLWFRRLLVGGVSTVTAGGLGLAGLLSSAGAASATSSFTINQIAGPNRFATAAAIAAKAFPNGANTVIVASGLDTNLSDSLAASYLAGAKNAPILLTNATGVPTETTNALASLKAKNVIIVGGTSAVSASQGTTFANGGTVTVTRVAGANRFETADQIDMASSRVGSTKTAIVADGTDAHLVDSLGSSPLADAGPYPVFLINGSADTLSAADLAIMKTDRITDVVIVGGSAAVGPQIATQLSGASITSVQKAGPDRSATSDALAEYEIAHYGFSTTMFDIASGAQAHLSDSLAGGPFGGSQTPPLPTLITDSVDQAASVAIFAAAHSATETSANIFGGSAAVDVTAEDATIAAAKTAPAVPTTLPTLVSASIKSTVTTGQVTPTSPAGTTIQYVLNQSVAADTIHPAGFHVFDSKDNRYTGIVSTTCGGGTVACVTKDATNPNAVDVLFPDTALQTMAGAATLTLATVGGVGDTGGPAVTSVSTGSNPNGSEPIGAGSTSTLTPGVTAAPDLQTVSGTRPAALQSGPGLTAVDLTFNKAAYVTPTASPGGGPFSLVLTNGSVVTCSSPTPGSTTASGGTSVGGNGTTTLTVVCLDDISHSPTTPLTTGVIARAYDAPGVVGTTAAGANPNPAEATVTTLAVTPDLTGVAIHLGANGGANDTIGYTFDAPLDQVVAGGLLAINSTGTTVATTGTTFDPASTANQVVVDYPAGALTNVVAGSVAPGTVYSGPFPTPSPNLFNELGAANSSTSSVTSGVVAAPQLVSVALAPFTNGSGSTVNGALFTFSHPVTAGAVAAGLHLYDADGTELTCTTTVASTLANTVGCTAFTTGSPTVAATTAQLASGTVTLGTADYGAVTGSTAPNTGLNPEGAATI